MCYACQKTGGVCVYDTRQDESRGNALKRKYEELEQRVRNQQDLFGMLRESPGRQATQILHRIRAGELDDAILASYRAHIPQSPRVVDLERTAILSAQEEPQMAPDSGLQSNLAGDHSAVAQDEHPFRPQKRDACGLSETPATLRGLPEAMVSIHPHEVKALDPLDKSAVMAVGVSPDLNPRKTRNMLGDIEATRSDESPQSKSPGRRDKDLSAVRACDWGVSYTDTNHFFAILDHYFIWDHYTYHFFDEDTFWEGLEAGGSVFCNKLLVHSIVAFTAVQSFHTNLAI